MSWDNPVPRLTGGFEMKIWIVEWYHEKDAELYSVLFKNVSTAAFFRIEKQKEGFNPSISYKYLNEK